jgi:predicted nucleic acid-binding protein
MILVDTSIWIDHKRGADQHLSYLLTQNEVAVHPFVIGELACGSLTDRKAFLELLRGLPQVASAVDEEVLFFIEIHRLFGRGAGFIDFHLMAAATLAGIQFWTRDKRLTQIAADLQIAYLPPKI